MRRDIENEYLLKAIDAFSGRMAVISLEYKVLASNLPEKDRPGERTDRTCYELFSQRTIPCEKCPAAEVIQTGKPIFITKPDILSQDSIEMPCRYMYPIRSGEKIEALASLDFDIPIIEKLDETINRSNAFLKNLILSSVDGVIAADKNGKILIFNAASAEISGYSIDEALNTLNIRDVYPDGGAYEVMRKLRSEEFGGKGKLKSLQVNVRKKTGEEIPISLNAAIVYEGNKEVATIGFFHDLRESIRIKQELEKTQIQLLQAEKMSSLGKLAAGVAHQLNNPLGGILLYTQLIMEEYKLGKAVQEDLNRILKDAERCRDTVRELLEFTRQTRHLMQPHDIDRALLRTIFLVQNHTIFQNIEIIKELSPNLPLLTCDIQQINHMFMNIIFNAAQAMAGTGKLTLKTYFIPENSRIGIEISDTGHGISPENLPHIFDPFFTTKGEGEGTGLGLSLVYGIVQNHGGSIKAISEVNEGATFLIELPITPQAKSGADHAE